jgi:fatty-acyl-CoA synthase
MPLLANNKLDKSQLRRDAWNTSAVWWRPGPELSYRPLTADDRAHLQRDFESHGRVALLP